MNILINGCIYQAAYSKFTDHISVVAETLPNTIAVINRRCLCYLADLLGLIFLKFHVISIANF